MPNQDDVIFNRILIALIVTLLLMLIGLIIRSTSLAIIGFILTIMILLFICWNDPD